MSCLSSPPGDHRSITSRPKLTLQTTSLPRTFGSSTTGLSLSFAAGTASPTVRNTFKNAYDVASPASATSSPSSKAPPSLRFNSNKPISPYVHHANNNPNSFIYRSPYQLPLGVRSILRNSPLESTSRRRSGSISAGTSGPGGAGARRVFFPAKKQVSYRNPLEEEIRTERYTAQHLDLFQEEETIEAVHGEADPIPEEPTPESAEDDDSDSASLLSLSETSSASSDDVSPNDGGVNTPLSKTERKKRRTMRAERQVRAVALLDGFDTDPYASSTPQTPRQGRVKRRREWKWTLGPVSASSDDVHPEVPMQILAPQPVDPPPEKPPGK
ncbi:hypothetical protein PoHVEF18_003653 [Penicillium ochrochloron]